MGKLTYRLIKYFIGIIIFVIIFCFISSSIFLSFIYTNMRYSELKIASNKIYEAIRDDKQYLDIISEYQISNGFFMKDGEIISLTATKMGTMSILKNNNLQSLDEKGKLTSHMNEEFLYYKNHTDIGDIILFYNNRFSIEYMKYTYIILSIIFLIALLISIPIVAILGKGITKPIIKLQKAALDITEGNFEIDAVISTKDEIEELSKSINYMAKAIEKKNAMQRDFIANVSHDFKTPLSVIRNYSEAIYDDIIEEVDKKEYIKTIIDEVDRLNILVIDILELSKLQGRIYTLNKEYVNLSEFLLEFKRNFKIQLQSKNIQLNIKALGSDVYILADGNYLYRVIYNFIDNAIKFCYEDGRVDIEAMESEEGIKISVKDNGVGIDSKDIDDIWERYYKSKSSGGMGLGLAICSEILKLHNFTYGVISEPEKGTEFFFIVPRDSIMDKK